MTARGLSWELTKRLLFPAREKLTELRSPSRTPLLGASELQRLAQVQLRLVVRLRSKPWLENLGPEMWDGDGWMLWGCSPPAGCLPPPCGAPAGPEGAAEASPRKPSRSCSDFLTTKVKLQDTLGFISNSTKRAV